MTDQSEHALVRSKKY